MKNTLFIISLLTALNVQAVTISNFGTDVSAADLQGAWVGNYSGSAITSTDAPGAGIQDFTGPAIGDVTGLGSVQLIANVTTSPGSNFNVILWDAQGDTVSTTFNWSNFTGGAQSVTAALSTNVNFNGDQVVGWEISTAGIGGSLGVEFTSLSAVPETSTYAALAGLCALGYVMVRRRK